MNQKRELVKNTLIISIGKFSTKLVSFLLLPLYTSLLSTAEYGQYSTLNTISIFLIPIITLQMDEAMFRFLIDAKTSSDKKSIFSQTVIFSLISTIIWTVLIVIAGELLNYEYYWWLIVYCFSSIVYTLASSFARGEGNFKLYSVLAFLNSLLNILLNILFIAVFDYGVEGLFLAYIISSIVIGLFGLFKLKAGKYIAFDKMKNIKEMIKYALPLVPSSISWSLITLTDCVFITNWLGDGAYGVYSAAGRFPTIINTCYGFFNTSWRESASKMVDKEEKNEFYNSVYLTVKRFLYGLSIVIIVGLPFVFNILINKSYSEAYYFIPFMIISIYYTNLSSFISGIFSAYKDTKILAPTTLIAALISTVVNFFLIRSYYLYAPVLGTLLAYFVLFIYRKYKLKKYIELPTNNELPINIIIMGICLFFYFIDNTWIHIGTLILGCSYAYHINKDLIGIFLNKKNFRFLNKLRRKKNG